MALILFPAPAAFVAPTYIAGRIKPFPAPIKPVPSIITERDAALFIRSMPVPLLKITNGTWNLSVILYICLKKRPLKNPAAVAIAIAKPAAEASPKPFDCM